VDAIHRAGIDARRVLGSDTGFCNYISHFAVSLPKWVMDLCGNRRF
jgi:hypothetical protein